MSKFLPIGEGSPRTLARQRQRLGLANEIIKYKVNEDFFFNWTDELAWVIGLIWTDGNIYKNRITVCSKDVEMLEKINQITENTRPLHLRKKSNAADWVCTNEKIATRLRDLGLHENKSLSIETPHIPIEYIGGFIRGCIDGDGTIRLLKKKGKFDGTLSVQICGKSKMKIGLSLIYENLGISYKIYTEKTGVWKIHVFQSESVRKLGKIIYHSHDVPCLKRKRDIYEYWKDVIHPSAQYYFMNALNNPECPKCKSCTHKATKEGKERYRCISCRSIFTVKNKEKELPA